jgi:pimeloyl-ACP methyl ester carboxylesterase
MIGWPDDFCAALAGRGFRLIRFDNRDIGLSGGFDALGRPDFAAILGGDPATVPYLLSDLADDTAALLKELGVDRAHVVGASMGGMVAQQLTIDHPDLVASLCSIMSTTGDRAVGHASPEAIALLSRPPAADREAAIAAALASARVLGSPGYPAAEDDIRQRAGAVYDRSFRPAGFARQYAAILGSGDRTAGLGAVTVPALVIHGEDDPLIEVSGGRATAAAIPGAELLVVPGMGHDLPRVLWPELIDAIEANVRRAG